MSEEDFIRIWKAGYLAGIKDGYNLCVPDPEGPRANKLAEKAWRNEREI